MEQVTAAFDLYGGKPSFSHDSEGEARILERGVAEEAVAAEGAEGVGRDLCAGRWKGLDAVCEEVGACSGGLGGGRCWACCACVDCGSRAGREEGSCAVGARGSVAG